MIDSDLDAVIKQVKQEFKSLLIKRRELITRLGNAFESVVSNPESICEEIKNSLKEEIADKIISARDIERFCPDKWKKRTKPKNDKLSFSDVEGQREKIVVQSDGSTAVARADSDGVEDGDIHVRSLHEEKTREAECPRCQQVKIKVQELEEALRKASTAVIANELIVENSNRDVDLEFEFPLKFETLRKYMKERSSSDLTSEVWISGELDRRTGKILSVHLGRRTERKTFAGCH